MALPHVPLPTLLAWIRSPTKQSSLPRRPDALPVDAVPELGASVPC